MLSKVYSAALVGLNAQVIEVEVDLYSGLHTFQVVGLPDAAVNESKERVSSAVRNCGFLPPQHSRRRVIVNLAPADLKKEGPAYDLPMAIAFLLSSDQLNLKDLDKMLFVGELSLEGVLRKINGILSIAQMAKDQGFQTIFVPKENAVEAALVKGLEVIPAESLSQIISHLLKQELISCQPLTNIEDFSEEQLGFADFCLIKGQEQVKRALEIAAAGSHNILMSGPPGAGKTLLARSFASILPNLDVDSALEVTRIFSAAGRLPEKKPILTSPPFRNPHHTSSTISLVGGGSYPRPGEITLAHRGVLFLDEFPEFSRGFLESLRQPLEDGQVTVSRASGSLTFPAKFILVAAMNPCPCGKFGDPKEHCLCSPTQITKYSQKVSGPLLDRIDLHIEVPRVNFTKLSSETDAESSVVIRERIAKARVIQRQRFQNEKGILTNSEMSVKQIKKYCLVDSASQNLLKSAMDQLHLSARSYHRVLKLARTIADLESAVNIETRHVAEALQYRPKKEE